MTKVSFVTTVKNDPKGLKILLDSLKQQTKQPDEVIVVDGEKAKSNRSQGRNLGIKRTQGEIIAVSDAGCRLDKNWLQEITTPFENSQVDVVAGYYKPITKSIFQKCLACYTCRDYSLPSSRSVAFRKRAWQRVGGYPRDLDYCEDLVFAERLKKTGCKFEFSRKAVVFWPQRENIFQAFWQFFNYASGDAQALYWPHLKKIFLVYLRYVLGILLFYWSWLYGYMAIWLYCLWAIWKNYRYVKHLLAFVYLPLLQLTADLAVMGGALRGLLKRI